MTDTLSCVNLPTLAKKLGVPAYDRDALIPGIVHIGVGNFHRAHQAVYLHELFNRGEGHDWALVGAGVREGDVAMRDALASQDFLTTIVEQEADKSTAYVTGAMIDFIRPGDHDALVHQMAQPQIRIVSLTITEGGYYINPATGRFDPAHPDIVHDANNPDQPKTVFGLILKALRQRRAKGVTPFTVMSCDNIPHNGVVTRNAVIGLAAAANDGLEDWVGTKVAFPNGMVDRITPATGERERTMLVEHFGVRDNWPVFCEDFKQWVLEDNFPAGRPALEKVGVQFVADVSPFELMKIRILNGGHAVIAYPSGLLDVHFVHEGMEHPLVKAFLDKIELEEIIPCVPPVPDTDISEYYRLIVRRFSNPKIGDTISRLCLDGSNRQPKFIVPSIRDRLAAGKSVTGLALESALWCRYCFGISDSGTIIPDNDPNWKRLQEVAQSAKADPMQWLAMDDIYGDVANSPVFREAFSRALNALWKDGTKATLEAYLANRL